MRQVINYSFRIEVVGDTDAPNPLHLCEEIQAYLNAHVCLDDGGSGEFADAQVVGYHVKRDNFTPFIAQEEY
tara:strand:- start:1652 stop:1867 length:216 start_codon:yes stop_codon:yes gene_type:complete